MKRYLVFAGEVYEPQGGGEDFQEYFDDLNYAIQYADAYVTSDQHSLTFAHVWDAETKQIVYRYGQN